MGLEVTRDRRFFFFVLGLAILASFLFFSSANIVVVAFSKCIHYVTSIQLVVDSAAI